MHKLFRQLQIRALCIKINIIIFAAWPNVEYVQPYTRIIHMKHNYIFMVSFTKCLRLA